MKLESENYLLKTTHHAKFHFDPTTWVVSVNSQLASVMFLSSSFFLFFFFSVSLLRAQLALMDRSSRSVCHIDVFVPKDVPFVDMPPI